MCKNGFLTEKKNYRRFLANKIFPKLISKKGKNSIRKIAQIADNNMGRRGYYENSLLIPIEKIAKFNNEKSKLATVKIRISFR